MEKFAYFTVHGIFHGDDWAKVLSLGRGVSNSEDVFGEVQEVGSATAAGTWFMD